MGYFRVRLSFGKYVVKSVYIEVGGRKCVSWEYKDIYKNSRKLLSNFFGSRVFLVRNVYEFRRRVGDGEWSIILF